jgi:hypothetical protein
MSLPSRVVYVLIHAIGPLKLERLAFNYNIDTKIFTPTLTGSGQLFETARHVDYSSMTLEELITKHGLGRWTFSLDWKAPSLRAVGEQYTKDIRTRVYLEEFPALQLTDVIEHAYASGTFRYLEFTAKHPMESTPKTGGGRRPRSRSSQKPRRVQKKRRGVSRNRSRSRRSASRQRRRRASRGTR